MGAGLEIDSESDSGAEVLEMRFRQERYWEKESLLQDSRGKRESERLGDTNKAVLGTDSTNVSEGFIRYLERHREEEKTIYELSNLFEGSEVLTKGDRIIGN
jgi:hypothetical protein